jgi:RNA polymerase primary sigma factor
VSSHARKLLPAEVLTHPSIAALVAGAAPTGTVSPEDVRRASDEAGVEPRHLKALLVHLSGLGISVQIDAAGMRAVAATSKRAAT